MKRAIRVHNRITNESLLVKQDTDKSIMGYELYNADSHLKESVEERSTETLLSYLEDKMLILGFRSESSEIDDFDFFI